LIVIVAVIAVVAVSQWVWVVCGTGYGKTRQKADQ
jgi:hypothetical protein